jgi:hypothetical protein
MRGGDRGQSAVTDDSARISRGAMGMREFQIDAMAVVTCMTTARMTMTMTVTTMPRHAEKRLRQQTHCPDQK